MVLRVSLSLNYRLGQFLGLGLLAPAASSRIDVENRDYHHLSQTEIDGAKRIYQHLSEPEHLVLQDDEHIC